MDAVTVEETSKEEEGASQEQGKVACAIVGDDEGGDDFMADFFNADDEAACLHSVLVEKPVRFAEDVE